MSLYLSQPLSPAQTRENLLSALPEILRVDGEAGLLGVVLKFLFYYLSLPDPHPTPAAFLGARNRFLERLKSISEGGHGDQGHQAGLGLLGG